MDELRAASDLSEAINADRRVTMDLERPSAASAEALRSFDQPGGRGQSDQIAPKPEDAAREAEAGTLWTTWPR